MPAFHISRIRGAISTSTSSSQLPIFRRTFFGWPFSQVGVAATAATRSSSPDLWVIGVGLVGWLCSFVLIGFLLVRGSAGDIRQTAYARKWFRQLHGAGQQSDLPNGGAVLERKLVQAGSEARRDCGRPRPEKSIDLRCQ